ncbi:uncharacterized protein [Hemitrygon akajei]|uniref:uncharacterized protein n=1 Tax=Hemitrygon akajei TaxID=2704970 RepID=UPI003BF9997F
MCYRTVRRQISSVCDPGTVQWASSDNGCFPSLSSETQRASDRMAKSETYMKRQFVKPDSLSPSGAKPDVSYVELHFKSLSVPRVRTNGDGPISTYSEMNFRRDDPLIDEEEGAHITSGPGRMPTTIQTDGRFPVDPLYHNHLDKPPLRDPVKLPNEVDGDRTHDSNFINRIGESKTPQESVRHFSAFAESRNLDSQRLRLKVTEDVSDLD